jgi:cell division protein FtsB
MTKRIRLTGFARFLFVMVILVPAAYIGASYYNGEDGLKNIKTLLGIESTQGGKSTTTDRGNSTKHSDQNASNAALEARIEALEQENRDLKVQIRDLKLELKATQLQLKNAKANSR